jgi:hypothetical protein
VPYGSTSAERGVEVSGKLEIPSTWWLVALVLGFVVVGTAVALVASAELRRGG